ncbi:hypothetical protein TSMEX_009766 [Taenia solium]|eukprot:TsM_001051100 transcript=TsM_001051100 gene=TsM_001051100
MGWQLVLHHTSRLDPDVLQGRTEEVVGRDWLGWWWWRRCDWGSCLRRWLVNRSGGRMRIHGVLIGGRGRSTLRLRVNAKLGDRREKRKAPLPRISNWSMSTGTRVAAGYRFCLDGVVGCMESGAQVATRWNDHALIMHNGHVCITTVSFYLIGTILHLHSASLRFLLLLLLLFFLLFLLLLLPLVLLPFGLTATKPRYINILIN